LLEVGDELHAEAALATKKSSRYPLDRWLYGPQSRSGDIDEGKRTLHRKSNSIVQPQPVAVLTELSRFLAWAVCVVVRGAGNYVVSFNRHHAGFVYNLHLLCTNFPSSVYFVMVGSPQPNVFLSLELRRKDN
jgi:hypothetical protein